MNISETPNALHFVSQMESIHASAKEEVTHLWALRDLFVDDFVSLLNQGLSYKKHPDVSDAFALFFTFAEPRKNEFFCVVIEMACERVGRERDNARTYLFHLANMIKHSKYLKQGMQGPKYAFHRLFPLEFAT